jgi:hypothetical protein
MCFLSMCMCRLLSGIFGPCRPADTPRTPVYISEVCDPIPAPVSLGRISSRRASRYKILQSCLSELMDKGVISPSQLILSDPSAREEEEQEQDMGEEIPVVFNNLNEGLSSRSRSAESYLWDIATQCEVLSVLVFGE